MKLAELYQRVDPTLLYPQFENALSALLEELLAQGKAYWVISGFRSYQEQNELYARGRDLAKTGKVVTNARGGQSAHNFGIAADLCLDSHMDRKGLQPDYDPVSYEPLRTLAPKHGLIWGGTWHKPDRPHVQWPGCVTAAELKPLRIAYEVGGLRAVWAYLDDGVCR